MKAAPLLHALRNGYNGLARAVREHRNLRYFLWLSLGVMGIAAALRASLLELALIVFAIGFVVAAEVMNSAIETTVNLMANRYDPQARRAKDTAAGGVMAALATALTVILFVLMQHNLVGDWLTGEAPLEPHSIRLGLIGLIAGLLVVILVKAVVQRGTMLRGGIISGHATLAFLAFFGVVFVSKSWVVIGLAFLLAVLVAQSRIQTGVHRFWEVAGGALLAAVIALTLLMLRAL